MMNDEAQKRFMSAAARIATDPTMRPFMEGISALYFDQIEELSHANMDTSPCKAAAYQGGANAYRHLIDCFNEAVNPREKSPTPQGQTFV